MLGLISIIILISLLMIKGKLDSVWVDVLEAEKRFELEDKVEEIIRG